MAILTFVCEFTFRGLLKFRFSFKKLISDPNTTHMIIFYDASLSIVFLQQLYWLKYLTLTHFFIQENYKLYKQHTCSSEHTKDYSIVYNCNYKKQGWNKYNNSTNKIPLCISKNAYNLIFVKIVNGIIIKHTRLLFSFAVFNEFCFCIIFI